MTTMHSGSFIIKVGSNYFQKIPDKAKTHFEIRQPQIMIIRLCSLWYVLLYAYIKFAYVSLFSNPGKKMPFCFENYSELLRYKNCSSNLETLMAENLQKLLRSLE